jgi:hypothetical protein
MTNGLAFCRRQQQRDKKFNDIDYGCRSCKTFSSSLLTKWQNKLECLSLAGLKSPGECLRVTLNGAGDKRSSFFVDVTDKEKKISNSQPASTKCRRPLAEWAKPRRNRKWNEKPEVAKKKRESLGLKSDWEVKGSNPSFATVIKPVLCMNNALVK